MDAIQYTRDLFLPSLTNYMTEFQAIYRNTNAILDFPGTLTSIEWELVQQMWLRIKEISPRGRWKRKGPLKDILRMLFTIQLHTNNIGLLRFLGYGLYNFMCTPSTELTND